MHKGKRAKNQKRSAVKTYLLLTQYPLIIIGYLPIALFKLAVGNLGQFKTSVAIFFKVKRLRKKLKRKIDLVPKKTRIIISLITILSLFFGYTFFTISLASQLPNPTHLTNPDQPLTSEFYDRNGKLLYRLYEGRNRTLVKLDSIPKDLINATIAIEDKNFYNHSGIDILAIARAFKYNYQNDLLSQDKNPQGASTITQQLIKNTLLTPEKTYQRKFKEAILSFWAERIYSKQQILQMYLNESPYGGPNWGIQAAAQTYFGKDISQLNLAESAYLAGLPASPTEFSPYGTKPELGIQRQQEVLRRMVEEQYITLEQAEKARDSQLEINPPINDILAPHFVMYVKDYLAQKYGPRIVAQGGLRIHTTLDLGLQEEVQKIVAAEVEKLWGLNVQNGAAMITDAKTGQILAMVGSRGYHYPGFGNYNVTVALRQPGSSIKPITYATAFKNGFIPGNTILDTPVVFRDEWGNSYTPINYDGRFHGVVSLRTALGSSYNIPAVKLTAILGVDKVIQTAKELGITTFTNPQDYGLSITLGGAAVKMIDMISAYGVFAQNGVKKTPTPILKVTDSTNNILEEYEDRSERVLQPEIAYLITNILSDNNARTAAFGPNSLLNIKGYAVAAKTGTSDDKRDNVTFGYSPDFVVGVWVGNPDNSRMHPSLTSGVTGAAPIWNRIMKGLLAKNPSSNFNRPAGIIEVNIDGRKDLAVSGILPKALVQTRRGKTKTTYFDTFSSLSTSSAQLSAKDNMPN